MYEQPFNPYIKNLTVIKEYFKTPRVLTISISQAIAAVLSLISGVLISLHMPDILRYVRASFLWACDQIDVTSTFREDILREIDRIDANSLSATVLSNGIVSLAIAFLIAAAFLILFLKSRSADPAASPKAGVMILYVFAILELIGVILCIIGFAAIIAFLFILYAQGGNVNGRWKLPFTQEYLPFSMDATVMLVVAIGCTIALVICAILLLIMAINRMRYYHSIKNSLTTVDLQRSGAKPYGVMCVIKAVLLGGAVLSAPSSLFASSPVQRPEILTAVVIVTALAQAASCVAAIMEASLALGYKKYIDNAKYGYTGHPAPAAPYAPFPGGASFTPQSRPQPNPYMPPAPAPEPEKPDRSTDNAYADPYGADASDASTRQAPAQDAAPKCPFCGAEADLSAPFCSNCGKKL